MIPSYKIFYNSKLYSLYKIIMDHEPEHLYLSFSDWWQQLKEVKIFPDPPSQTSFKIGPKTKKLLC